MSFLAWIVLGLLAGFIGRKIVNKRGEGVIVDIVLGIVGAIVGAEYIRRLRCHGAECLQLAGRCHWFSGPTGRLPRHSIIL